MTSLVRPLMLRPGHCQPFARRIPFARHIGQPVGNLLTMLFEQCRGALPIPRVAQLRQCQIVWRLIGEPRVQGPAPTQFQSQLRNLLVDALVIRVSIGRIEAYQWLPGPHMVAVLNDLQTRGLILRSRDPRDARKNALTVTPDGHRLLGRLEELGDRANDALLAPLDAAEREQLTALLGRLVADRAGH